MTNPGAEFFFRPSPNVSKDPDVTKVQTEISTLRQEYASNDYEVNTHEYMGVVEDLEVMLDELHTKLEQTLAKHPEATFILEYHKSCALPKESGFLIYSFGLQARVKEEGGERRHNYFIGWKIDFKPEYPQENAMVEAFMAQNGIQPYIDDFQSASPRRCRIDNEDK